MLAFGRAMIAQPSMILMDEPSLGLAPNIISEIFETIRRFNAEDGISILLVEQNANVAFSVADYCYIMEALRNFELIRTYAAFTWELGLKVKHAKAFMM